MCLLAWHKPIATAGTPVPLFLADCDGSCPTDELNANSCDILETYSLRIGHFKVRHRRGWAALLSWQARNAKKQSASWTFVTILRMA